MTRGFFITLEGGEGVGKSTQIKNLSTALQARGYDVVITREPGGTPAAEAIRALLSDPALGPDWSPEAEALLLNAARAMHIRDVIEPALEAGKVVISDRYVDSTRVYQGYVQKLDPTFMHSLEKYVSNDVMPDLTFVLDLPAADSLKRMAGRSAKDHYDNADEEFHEHIRKGFLEIARQEPGRCVIIDATQPFDAVTATLIAAVNEKLD